MLRRGEMQKLRDWLAQNEEKKKEGLFCLFSAIVAQNDHLKAWEIAVHNLEKENKREELLHAYQQAAKWSEVGEDIIRHRKYLQKAKELAQELSKKEEALHLQVFYANRLLQDGYITQAHQVLQQALQQAIRLKDDLMIVTVGTTLTGLLMNQQDWEEVISVSIAVEEASIRRKNWIGLACGRMMRASAWKAQGKNNIAVQLLFDTGNALNQIGAVAALNLIKARLAEFQQMGIF